MTTRKRRTTFRVVATRESIDNSERNSLHWCIFALAIGYSIPGAIHISVDKDETRFSYKGMRYIFRTPPKSAEIAESYDRGVLSKREVRPWDDILEDPISVEPVQHKRPKRRAATNQKVSVKRKRRTGRCDSVRSTRWNGGKLR